MVFGGKFTHLDFESISLNRIGSAFIMSKATSYKPDSVFAYFELCISRVIYFWLYAFLLFYSLYCFALYAFVIHNSWSITI